MRSSRAVLAVCGTLALGCAGLEDRSYAIEPADHDVVLEAAEVVQALGLTHEVDPSAESWTKQRAFDGAWEVEYEYESDELYVMHSLFVDATASDARTVYLGLSFGMNIADAGEQDFELVEVPGLLEWGDQQECNAMRASGLDVGVMCIAQKGRRSMLLSVTALGAGLSEPGSVDALLGARLGKIEAYEPRKTEFERETPGSSSGSRGRAGG